MAKLDAKSVEGGMSEPSEQEFKEVLDRELLETAIDHISGTDTPKRRLKQRSAIVEAHQKAITQAEIKLLEKLKTYLVGYNYDAHGREDCKSCPAIEELDAELAARKEQKRLREEDENR